MAKIKYLIQNGKELTKKEYIAYLEGMAEGISRMKRDDGIKFSDPLYIGNDLNDVYSYVFDFHDGGRHHKFNSLEGIHEALLNEIRLALNFEV
jgi:hypothetical protein